MYGQWNYLSFIRFSVQMENKKICAVDVSDQEKGYQTKWSITAQKTKNVSKTILLRQADDLCLLIRAHQD